MVKREQRGRKAPHGGTAADADRFEGEILPVSRGLPLSDLARATGLTHGYLSRVRRGKKVPHPRQLASPGNRRR
jgi:hypothetical protein